jgi:hypothetical protein
MKKLIILALILFSCVPEEISKPKDMGKVITAPNWMTGGGTQLANNADVPVTLVVNGNDVDCSNIAPEQVGPVLGVSTRDWGELCTSQNVNAFSLFAPTEWYWTGVVLANRIKYPYDAGNFAGYNHNAEIPATSDDITLDLPGNRDVNTSIAATMYLGEIDWRTIGLIPYGGIAGIGYEVKRGGSFVAKGAIDYTDDVQKYGASILQNVTNPQGSTSSYTVRFYFTTDEGDEYTEICDIPGGDNIKTVAITLYYPPLFGDVDMDADMQSAHPTWEAVWNEGLSSLDQGVSNDTFTIKFGGFDSDSDGEGDHAVFGFDVYVSKRSDKTFWYLVAENINIIAGTEITIAGDLPFEIEDNDIIDFEIRE